jgi:hemolysin activation/secretion protein
VLRKKVILFVLVIWKILGISVLFAGTTILGALLWRDLSQEEPSLKIASIVEPSKKIREYSQALLKSSVIEKSTFKNPRIPELRIPKFQKNRKYQFSYNIEKQAYNSSGKLIKTSLSKTLKKLKPRKQSLTGDKNQTALLSIQPNENNYLKELDLTRVLKWVPKAKEPEEIDVTAFLEWTPPKKEDESDAESVEQEADRKISVEPGPSLDVALGFDQRLPDTKEVDVSPFLEWQPPPNQEKTGQMASLKRTTEFISVESQGAFEDWPLDITQVDKMPDGNSDPNFDQVKPAVSESEVGAQAKAKFPQAVAEEARLPPNMPPKNVQKLFVKQINVKGSESIGQEVLFAMLDLGEGKEMPTAELISYAQKVTDYYGSQGYILAEAFFPPQEVVNGVANMVVSEGKISQVIVKGNEKIKEEDLVNRIQIAIKDKAFKEESLEKVLLELNELMGLTVKSSLKPGELPGTSNLILEVTEEEAYSFALDGDNFGSSFTGENRFGAQGSVGNLFDLGDQFFVRGVRSDEDLNSVQTYYLIPVNDWGTTVKFDFTYSEHTLGQSLSALKAGGDSHLYNLEIGHTLFKTRDFRFAVQGGMDYRLFENEQLGTLTSEDEIFDLYLGFSGDWTDRFLGQNYFSLRLQQGLNESDENRELTSRTKGRGNITVGTVGLTRYQSANLLDSYFILKATGQATSDRVLSPDQFAIGGAGTVRGFPLAEHSGDNGYALTVEYVLPVPLTIPYKEKNFSFGKYLALTSFWDFGEIFIKDKQTGEVNKSISGYGVGVQLNLPKLQEKKWQPTWSFSASYARPLSGDDPSDGSDHTWYVNGAINF